MKQLYLDCGMGAAGDMLTAALVELFPDRAAVVAELNQIGIPGIRYVLEPAEKCGILGSRMSVLIHSREEEPELYGQPVHHHDHNHAHSTPSSIAQTVSALRLDKETADRVCAVYRKIADAESKVHGVPVEQIHFHEVGSLDALADVAAVCYLLRKLAPDRICASPVHVGSGRVNCAHGILPVPAPATAELLKGIPTYGGSITGELCTPTGAALLREFVDSFGAMPVMAAESIGYGMGKKDFAVANCLRAIWGHTDDHADSVIELRCNLDDMTGEEIGYAVEELFRSEALDVFTTPIGMKKNRPGILLTVLCKPQQRDVMVERIFHCTTTLGIRETICPRYILTRRIETCGSVHRKISQGYGVTRVKAEYEDLAKIAREHDLPWPLRDADCPDPAEASPTCP